MPQSSRPDNHVINLFAFESQCAQTPGRHDNDSLETVTEFMIYLIRFQVNHVQLRS